MVTAMSTIEVLDYSANLWGRDIRTLYNVNRPDSREFLRIAGDVDLSVGVETFSFADLPEAMIRLKRGRLPWSKQSRSCHTRSASRPAPWSSWSSKSSSPSRTTPATWTWPRWL